MPPKPVPDEVLRERVEAYRTHGLREAARRREP